MVQVACELPEFPFLLSSPICFGLGILGLLLVIGLLYPGQASDTFRSPRRFWHGTR